MAKIVLIGKNNYRPEINEIGDIISIHDDDVELNGPGYDNVQIIIINNLTKAQLRAKLKENWPERKMIDGIRYWQNSDDLFWYKINKRTKYMHSVKDLSQQNISKLQQENITAEEKLNIFGMIPAKFTTIVDNTTTTEYMLWDTGEFE